MSLFDSGPVLLDGPDTMMAVLKELVGEDALKYRGLISVWGEENPPGPPRWQLELNDDRGNSSRSKQGQYLALVYGRLLVLDPDEVEE